MGNELSTAEKAQKWFFELSFFYFISVCYKLFADYVDDDVLLKKINVNTLITTGENDIGSTPEMSKNLTRMIQTSKFVEIKNGKHLCSIECADDVNITVKKFIDQNND